jgi:hypothetical protein
MTRDDKFGWLQSAYVLIVSWLGVWSFHAHTPKHELSDGQHASFV